MDLPIHEHHVSLLAFASYESHDLPTTCVRAHPRLLQPPLNLLIMHTKTADEDVFVHHARHSRLRSRHAAPQACHDKKGRARAAPPEEP